MTRSSADELLLQDPTPDRRLRRPCIWCQSVPYATESNLANLCRLLQEKLDRSQNAALDREIADAKRATEDDKDRRIRELEDQVTGLLELVNRRSA